LAFTKNKKVDMTARYEKWLTESQAIFVLQYTSLTMKEIDALRAKARETGGEIHLVKNTLFTRALQKSGYVVPEFLDGTSLVGFAFNDAPSLAKSFTEFVKGNETRVIKGGFLGKQLISAKQVKALADLPSLPVMRATLLGVLQAPASKLVRTLVEPARSMAAVVKAYSEKAPLAV